MSEKGRDVATLRQQIVDRDRQLSTIALLALQCHQRGDAAGALETMSEIVMLALSTPYAAMVADFVADAPTPDGPT